jgi:peptide/nickel transport system permease protein
MDAPVAEVDAERLPPAPSTRPATWRRVLRNWSVRIGGMVLVLLGAASLLAPWLGTIDPTLIDPVNRDQLPGTRSEVMLLTGETFEHTFLMGSDSYGRDIFSRVLYGGRVSLVVGVTVAVLSLFFGVLIGLASGYIRALDSVVMRVMDGLMAIPGILLAIALVALWGASLPSVLLAITVPEIPRVARLARSVVLATREEPYVEAARITGTRTWKIIVKHLMPNTMPPLIVQGTNVCASAIMIEAILSFIGAGMSTEVPTWGNIIAEGRLYFQLRPGIVLWPGLVLSVTILCINLLGDAARDVLDPRVGRPNRAS